MASFSFCLGRKVHSYGRRTLGIIRFNIIFALGLKAVFLGLALRGQTSLWLAIMAYTGATLLVVANALRLLRSSDWGFYGDALASLSILNY